MGGFLMALRVRGETVDEYAAAATRDARRMQPVKRPPKARWTSSAPAATARAR
jgi:anthranilate phosphoribosyltransferase